MGLPGGVAAGGACVPGELDISSPVTGALFGSVPSAQPRTVAGIEVSRAARATSCKPKRGLESVMTIRRTLPKAQTARKMLLETFPTFGCQLQRAENIAAASQFPVQLPRGMRTQSPGSVR